MNPCGRAVDWIQFPFEVDALVHRGAGAPIVRQRWVFTDQPFLPVGTGSIINNRVWNKDQISLLEVGQLPPAEANFRQDARWRLPAGLKGDHMCHPEWFATGEPWPTDLPPNVYGPNWIPECCGLFQDAAEGGVQLGGEAGDVFTGTDPAEGGVQLGGYAGSVPAGTDPAEGGVQLGGYAGSVPAGVDPAEGGVQLGGYAGSVPAGNDPAEGGVQLGGEAGDVFTGNDPAEGGVQLGGLAGDVFNNGVAWPFTNGTLNTAANAWACSTANGFYGSSRFDAPATTIVEFEIHFNNDVGVPSGSITWKIGTAANASDVASGTASGVFTYIGVDANGFDHWRVVVAVSVPVAAGTYWLTANNIAPGTISGGYWYEATGGTQPGQVLGPMSIPSGFYFSVRS